VSILEKKEFDAGKNHAAGKKKSIGSSSIHSKTSLQMSIPRLDTQTSWFHPHLMEDELIPLVVTTLIKVRNVNPVACLHELHIQRPTLFPMPPTFKTIYAHWTQTKMRRVECHFKFNGGRLYTYDIARRKSDGRFNAARSMVRKLYAIPKLSISYVDQSTRLLEYPRCQLLNLHDTNPEMYPIPPTFGPSHRRSQGRSRKNIKCIYMVCYFQVRREKLAVMGIANNKWKAIVLAARNMLKQIFPNLKAAKDQILIKQAMPDRQIAPWTCHFCNVFMTGRLPFLSHLAGRRHVKKMAELRLNFEKDNKILQASAKSASKKKELEKSKAPLKSLSQQVTPRVQ